MKKASFTRKIPRKIAQDEDEPAMAENGEAEKASSVLQRPTARPRKVGALRHAVAPSSVEDEEPGDSALVVPKRSNLSRTAIHRNAAKHSALFPSNLPARQVDDDEGRPSYNAASLLELKASTPSTPREVVTDEEESADLEHVATGTKALDLSSKFGSALSRYQQSSAVPSAAEIAEKKARRARLAKEQQAEEYISLDLDDPALDNDDNVERGDDGRLVLKVKDKYGHSESRLVRDDEDIMENFDDFTEDGKMTLGRKAEAEAARRKREEMGAQIAEAEGNDDLDEESDASEKERNMAFEAAQTRHGMYGSNAAASSDPYEHLRARTPPKISPLPTLDGVLERLRKQMNEMQALHAQKLHAMEALQREKIRLGEEEIRIQRALKETAMKFKQMREEKGITLSDESPMTLPRDEMLMLEEQEQMDNEEMDDEGGHVGLGFGGGLNGGGASGIETARGGELEGDGKLSPGEAMTT